MKLPEQSTVSGFTCLVLNISLPEFHREVKTIMLNNAVVDNPDSCHLKPGDTLVLSGAMPGLVGAMLRSDSPIKAMRNSISHNDGETRNCQSASGYVLVKFFNTILKNHRHDIIRYGFISQE